MLTIKDLVSASYDRQTHAVLKRVTKRKIYIYIINGERKRKLEENLEVLKKKKKCIVFDIKEVITSIINFHTIS